MLLPKCGAIVLETDSPFMVPNNVYDDIPVLKGKRLPLCHSGMIPWTAKFVAGEGSSAAVGVEPQTYEWDADRAMAVARENARTLYGI